MLKQPKALFLDRDGVINVDGEYTNRIDEVEFIPGIFELVRRAVALAYLPIVITNQAGIGRGYYTEDDFHTMMEWMQHCFVKEGGELADIYFCPYHPEHGKGAYKRPSLDRKPAPGMLLKAQAKHNLNMTESLLIGDKESDIQAGFAAGVGTLLLLNQEDAKTLATKRIARLEEAFEYLK